MGKKRFRINPRLFKKIKMTNYEQIIQLTEVITNLEKDITSLADSKKTSSKDDLSDLEQYYQYLESTLQELKNQKEKLISEL
jgi:replicative DNA helicase